MKTGLTKKFVGVVEKAVSRATKDIQTKVERAKKKGIKRLNKRNWCYFKILLIDLIKDCVKKLSITKIEEWIFYITYPPNWSSRNSNNNRLIGINGTALSNLINLFKTD